MSEENIQENVEKEIISNDDYSKPNFVNQIDDIINKYKTQLENIKTNTNINTIQNKNELLSKSLPKINPTTFLQNNISTLNNPSLIQSANIQNNSKQFSSELSKEIQNDNIKLQSALTSEKLNVVKLNSQLEKYEIELNKSKQYITDLQNQLSIKDNDFINQINSINNDINKIKDENDININIIQNFFELFNKNIDLFNKSKIITCDKNTRILYLKNDYEGNNQKLSVFVLKSLDILINKLLQDNKELYEQLIETKNILDQQNNLQREIEDIKDIKEENLLLKEQLQNLLRENEMIKNDNFKLKKNLIELNNYINSNINNYNNNNEKMNTFHGNQRNNYFNNYKRQRINSYNEHNMQNLNKNNRTEINNEKSFKMIKENYSSSRNIKRNINIQNSMKNINSYINKNSFNSNNTYCKTDENRKINNNEIIIENNGNNNKTYEKIENQKIKKIVKTGFERPIEQLKKKIMLLEQQIKKTPEK